MKTKQNNNNNKIMNDYQIALSKMPERFTSHDYLTVLRTRALPKSMIQKATHKSFLAEKCEQLTKKTWRKTAFTKKDAESVTVTSQSSEPVKSRVASVKTTAVDWFSPTAPQSVENRINQAIQLLKDNNYKVYRVVEELV